MFSNSYPKYPYSRTIGAILLWVSVVTLGAFAQASSLDDNSTLHLPVRPARETTFAKRTSEHHSGVRFHASAATADSVIRAKAGPWGDLEYYTVYLEATKAELKSAELPTYDTEWNFVGYS